MLPQIQQQRSLSPKAAAVVDVQRPMHYHVDGSGRDTYIHRDNGGFTQANCCTAAGQKAQFQRNLRTYQPDNEYLSRHTRRNNNNGAALDTIDRFRESVSLVAE